MSMQLKVLVVCMTFGYVMVNRRKDPKWNHASLRWLSKG